MDRLYTPWRFAYVTGQTDEEGCVFCNRLECDDVDQYVLHRGAHWYIIMNHFPYTNGHMLLVLKRHESTLTACRPEELAEMSQLIWIMETALREAVNPHGVNCGYNGGSSAGAGIPEHFHLHMLPRWSGDTNFMTTIAETRIMPQTLRESYDAIAPVMARLLAKSG